MDKDSFEFSVFPPRFKATGKFAIVTGIALFALTMAATIGALWLLQELNLSEFLVAAAEKARAAPR